MAATITTEIQTVNGVAGSVAHITTTTPSVLLLDSHARRSGDYAWQMWAKAASAASVVVSVGNLDYSFNLTDAWVRYEHVFTGVSVSATRHVQIKFPAGEFWLYECKLEQGNKTTQWSPAPEDAEEAVRKLDVRLDQQEIFNRLTNNGEVVGIFLNDGQLFINADYIRTGVLTDLEGQNYWNLDTGEFVITNGSLRITTDDGTYDVIDMRGKAGQWRSKITPLEFWLTNEDANRSLQLQAGGIWGYAAGATEDGMDISDSLTLNITPTGKVYLGKNGENGAIYLYDTNGVLRGLYNPTGVTLTAAVGSGKTIIQAGGLWVYDENGALKAQLDAGTGNLAINGTLRAGVSNAARMQYASGILGLYDSNNTLRTWIQDSGYIELRNQYGTKQVSLDGSDGAIAAATLDLASAGRGITLDGAGYTGWGFFQVKDTSGNYVYVLGHKQTT